MVDLDSGTFRGPKCARRGARFNGGYLGTDRGALLLHNVDRAVGCSRFLAECCEERRDQRFVEHSAQKLVAQWLYSLALGWENVNTHAYLRRDSLLAAANKADPLGTNRSVTEQGRALA